MASDPVSKTTTVAHWYGRRSADPMTIYCTNSGWREATWERDKRGNWYEAEATMRLIIKHAPDGSGRYELGEPRRVK